MKAFVQLLTVSLAAAAFWMNLYRVRNPPPVPAVTVEGNTFHFPNPTAINGALTVEQYATLYNLDPLTVRALCVSGQIAGAQCADSYIRHWLIPGTTAYPLTVSDLATAHGVADRTIRDWIDAGRISPAPVKINREWHIPAKYTIKPLP